MGALGAIWGNVLTVAKTAGQDVLTAAENAAAQGINQVRTAAGGAIEQTGIGIGGGVVAPAGSAPSITAWIAQNPEIVLLGLVALVFILRGKR